MSPRASMVKPGLTLDQYRQFGATLRQMRADLKAIRTLIKDHLGSADTTYGTATRAMNSVKSLQTALLCEATGAHVDAVPLAELRALYNDHGEG
jgi:hypothetical protein